MSAVHAQGINGATEFLEAYQPRGPWVITAIEPMGPGVCTRGFAPGEVQALVEFVTHWNGVAGLYFQVNVDLRSASAIRSKGRKEHIRTAMALQADVDVYKAGGERDATRGAALDRLASPPGGIPGPPSIIIDSGNGLQPLWLLDHPVLLSSADKIEEVEARNRAIATAFGGDSTFDINRIMRLPGTINLPNKRKQALGLVPVEAHVLSIDTTVRYALEAFAAQGDRQPTSSIRHGMRVGEPTLVDDLDQLQITARAKAIIQLGAYPDEHHDSRSEWLFALILSMIRSGEPNEVILGVITDGGWAISASVLEKPEPERYACRQIVRAHAWLSAKVKEEFDA